MRVEINQNVSGEKAKDCLQKTGLSGQSVDLKCGLKASGRGATYAFCEADICIAGGGKTDVDRHLKTAKHVNTLSQMQVQPSLSTFMSDSRARSIAMRADTYFAKFVAEHNLPFLVADHFSRLAKVMFPDSKIHHVVTRFLGMPVCNIATAEKLFDALDTNMKFHGTMWFCF